jgi:hypothetical protein
MASQITWSEDWYHAAIIFKPKEQNKTGRAGDWRVWFGILEQMK